MRVATQHPALERYAKIAQALTHSPEAIAERAREAELGQFRLDFVFDRTWRDILRNSELPNSVKAEIAWPGLIAGIVMLVWAWWFDLPRAFLR